MNSTDHQTHQLQLRVRELETRVLQLEDRVVFSPPAQQEPGAVIVANLVREGINKHRARELADHFIGLTPPPHKLPTPPGQAPIADTCFAEGWNACCDAFFGGLPPPEPLIVTVTQEVLTQRKPLTNAEMDDCLRRAGVIATLEVLRCIGREVEAAHGIKE